MIENSVLYEDYPEDREVGIPAKWIFIAENLLNEEQYKEWLFQTMRYVGFCGMDLTGDSAIDMVLNAVYDDNNKFFDEYFNSILKQRQKKLPIADQLKVMRAWTKKEQLDAYYFKR